jgi:hypothetical protein
VAHNHSSFLIGLYSLTVVEAIILFMIDTYRSTFLCFLELVIRGALAVLIGAVQTVGPSDPVLACFMQSTFTLSLPDVGLYHEHIERNPHFDPERRRNGE